MRNATTRLTALVATLAFLDLALWLLIVPLLPALEDDAGLSKAEAGIVLAAYSAAVLLASLPVGYVADRLGPRRITVAAAFLFAILAPMMAIADDFASLVAVRFGQGLFSAVSWTAGMAWLTASVPAERRGRTLATVSAAASLAPLAGPVLGGPVVAAAGLGPTLVVFAIVVLAVAVWALFERGDPVEAEVIAHAPPERPVARLVVMRAGIAEPHLRSALVAITLASSTAGVVQLLAPLHLDDEGVSEPAIGWLLTAAAAVALCATLTTRRVADRIDRLRAVTRAVAVVVLVVGLFLLDLPVPAYVVVLIALTCAQAPIWVLSYPLCAEGAERAGVGHGLAMGALNTMWAIGALASPAAAGVVAEAAGDAAAYSLAIAVLLCGLVVLAQAARQGQASSAASSSGEVTGRRQAKRSHT